MDPRALDTAPLATVVLRDGRVVYLNRAAAAMVGRPAAEIVGGDFRQFLPPEEMERLSDRLRRRLRGEQVPDAYEADLVLGGLRRRLLIHAAVEDGDVVLQAVDVGDRVAQRERLMELARLGARLQRGRSDEEVLAGVLQGLSALGFGTLLARPSGERLRVDLIGLSPPALQAVEEAMGRPPIGVEFPWPATSREAWREGVSFSDELPAVTSQALGAASAGQALSALGLTRVVTVRVDVADRPHALLGVLGPWLREEDLPAFRLFGAQLSAALDAARAIRDLSRRNEELAALNRLGETAATAPDLPTFFARGAEELRRTLSCDGVALWLLDEARDELELAFAVGASDELRAAFGRIPLRGTLSGQVLGGGGPRLLQLAELRPEVRPMIERLGFRTQAAVPLRVRSRAAGLMYVGWREPRDEAGARLDLLQAMGGPFAAAVEARRLLSDLRGRVSELTLLHEVALAAGNLNPVYLLETALRRVLDTLGSDAGNAYLVDGGELVRAGAVGLSEETLGQLRSGAVDPAEGEAGEAVRRMEPVLIPRLSEGSSRARLLREHERLETGLAVPIAVKGRALGALVIARRLAQPYRPEEVHLVSAVAAQLGVALENARLFADTRRRVADLEAVNQLSLSVFGSGPGDAGALLGTAAGEIGRALSARSVSVLLVRPDGGGLRRAASWEIPGRQEALPGPAEIEALAGRALETQGPEWSAGAEADPGAGGASAPTLAVPLTSRRARRGAVAITADPGRRLGEAEVALAFALATTAANALEAAELHAETRRRAEELGLLLEVGRSLVATLDLQQVLDAGVVSLARMVGAPDAYLFLVDPPGRELEVRAAAGSFPELVGSRIPVDPPQDSLGAMVFHRREPLVVEDGAAHPAVHPEALGLGRGSAYLGLPLSVRDRTIGSALIVDPRGPRRFTAAEVERAAAIANQLAVAVENARLYHDLRRSYADLAKAQAQLVHRERLAALGELSAVVAHEVRNPLGVIFNSLGSLRRLLKPEGDARMLLDIVGEEADRLNRIVGDLIDFARPSTPALRPEPLDRLLEEAVGTAVAENRDVAVERDVEAGLPLVSMDARLMRQAVLNLAVNAVQAMPRGGRLTVRARRDGAWARVEIRDSGPGIPDEIRHRIFEPFFTTKASGTGLGLAVVRRIVEDHGGEVAVASEPGQGTAVTIRIPLEPGPAPAQG